MAEMLLHHKKPYLSTFLVETVIARCLSFQGLYALLINPLLNHVAGTLHRDSQISVLLVVFCEGELSVHLHIIFQFINPGYTNQNSCNN